MKLYICMKILLHINATLIYSQNVQSVQSFIHVEVKQGVVVEI